MKETRNFFVYVRYLFIHPIILLFVSGPITVSGNQTITISELRKYILSRYENRYAPPEWQGKIYGDINIGLYVRSINHFDEVNGVLKTTVLAPITWQDVRSEWDYDSTGINYISLSSQEVWVPNIMIENSVENFLLFDPEVSYPVDADWQGYLSIVYGGVIVSQCNANVRFYPFDKHQCNITLGATESWYFHIKDNMEVHYKKDIFGNITILKENAQWKITLGEPSDIIVHDIKLVNFPIELERRPTFTVITLIVPIIFLCLLNVFVFFIPPTSGERMSFAITVLLAFSVYMSIVSANVPESDPVPLYNLFLVFKLTYSATIALCAILSVRVYEREGTVSPTLQSLVLCCKSFPCCCCNRRSKYKKRNSKEEELHDRTDISEMSYPPGRVLYRHNGLGYPDVHFRSNRNRDQRNVYVESEEKQKEITWKDVSYIIDKTCFIIFFLIVGVEVVLSFAFTLEKSLS